ncbi:GNAT family N-acetyltransferase [Brevibacillus nitrificans]|uniref:GNAT family N-acetyltransferase n=1 Tax=Brevibacillus nitrificans TaxID=651560 RepID=A0A3M8CVY5_9BACL|nr:GNAT family N-acetyltransferase [Brevibacillus nitrificans]RNB79407.1 GNAT family N-acetyltransferase [Brevibacillus nitrificans]
MIFIKRMSDCTFSEVTKAWNRGFEGYFFPVAMTEEMLVQRLGAEGYVLSLSVVAFDDQEPVGLVASGLRTINGRKIAWNGGTGVATAYRRKGLGRQLMEATFQLYEEAGVHDATLEAISENEKAIALYEQLGYDVVDRLIFWQRTDALPENPFGIQDSAGYRVRHVLAQEAAQLPYYQSNAPWQNQWQSMRDGEALVVEDAVGQEVGYAMYKRVASDAGKVTAIALRHCVAQPDHADADTILRVALTEMYAPYELECRRSTFNLPASQEQLLHILQEAGFGPSGTEQVYMVKKMKMPETVAELAE